MEQDKTVYAHGELGKVRQRLGDIDPEEAKRMAKILGGEVGVERADTSASPVRASASQPKHRIESILEDEKDDKKVVVKVKLPPEDDPAIPIKSRYWDRVRMDRYLSHTEFDIKSPAQAFMSALSLLSTPTDSVSRLFVEKRINDYYRTIEQMVLSTRSLFPRNNKQRNEQFKRISPLAFSILDTIRHWNIERISSDITRIQAYPRNVVVGDFMEILRAIYKPLFILEKMDTEIHVKESFMLLYKLLYREDPVTTPEKYKKLMEDALVAYYSVRNDIHYLLYPFLLKILSATFVSYELFFSERKHRFMAFLNVKEEEQLVAAPIPDSLIVPQSDSEDDDDDELLLVEDGDPVNTRKKAKNDIMERENKAVQQGLYIMETLFPKGGWKSIDQYPDIFPYFTSMFDLKNGYELIAPHDPLLHIIVLMQTLENMFFGLRFVKFNATTQLEPDLTIITSNWRTHMDASIDKGYLPRLVEYCTILENEPESKNAIYTKRLYSELQWIRRLFFMPYYTFDIQFPSPFKKEEIVPLYIEVRKLRRILTGVASGIDTKNKDAVGSLTNAWEPYNFQVANPVSARLNLLLSDKKRNNASLVFFTLSIATVLDYLINNDSSWAYREHSSTGLFRSIANNGTMPQFGVDTKIDADSIFRQTLKETEKNANP
jgi:hypothetical protein